MRGLRTLIGQAWLYLLQLSTYHRAKVNTPADPSQLLAVQHYVHTHQIAATINLDYNNYILAANFTGTQLKSYANLYISPNLTHDTLIRAFVWLLATFDSPRWNAPELLRLLFQQTPLQTRASIYDFCFAKHYIYSHLALASFTDAEFYRVLLNEIKAADSEFTENLHQAYETTVLALPQNDKPTTFISLNDDGSAELFYDFARLHGFANSFDKLILHATASPSLTILPPNLHYDPAPDTLLAKILQPRLKKSF